MVTLSFVHPHPHPHSPPTSSYTPSSNNIIVGNILSVFSFLFLLLLDFRQLFSSSLPSFNYCEFDTQYPTLPTKVPSRYNISP